MQYSRCGPMSAKWRVTIASFDLLAIILLMQARLLLAFASMLLAHVHLAAVGVFSFPVVLCGLALSSRILARITAWFTLYS